MNVLAILVCCRWGLDTGIEAGPAAVSCEDSVVTLWAQPINPPANYLIEWEDGQGPGVFLVVNPAETTEYRVFLTDLDSLDVYQDQTKVLVHPLGADLVQDGMFNDEDWLAFYAGWGGAPDPIALDPDGDQRVSILDWFYFCNFDAVPINTPPTLSVEDVVTPFQTGTLIPYQIDDEEQTPSLGIASQPANGVAFILSGQLRYDPNPGFAGTDHFEVFASDGILQTPPRSVAVEVLEADTYQKLREDIFLVYCKACHLGGVVSGGLSLDTYAMAQQGGNSGAAFVAGNPSLSPLYLRVANGSMPLGMEPLSALEIERIRLWIERGAIP